MAGDNVDVIESAWAAFKKRDLDGATSIVTEAAEVRIPETLPFGGTYVGPDGFRAYCDRLLQAFDDVKAVPEKVLSCDDNHVLVVASVTVRVKGERLESRSAWVYRLRDGSVVEAEAFSDTAAILQALS